MTSVRPLGEEKGRDVAVKSNDFAEQDLVSVRSEFYGVPSAAWRILVVDDDQDVHETTQFALRNTRILGRPVQLLHAYSATEAEKIVDEDDSIAVILLDVVMEHEDAGLKLVETLRDKGHRDVRIVLRTGFPGYAPESRIIDEHEINDYYTKDELTRSRLVTALTTAVRSYDQIRTMSIIRSGLEMIVEGTRELYGRRNLERFGKGVLTQIAALLHLEPQGAISAAFVGDDGQCYPDDLQVISGLGRFAEHVGKTFSSIDGIDFDYVRDLPENINEPVTHDLVIAMRFSADEKRELLVYFEHQGGVAPGRMALLRLFAHNLAICFENLALIGRLDELAFIDQRLKIANQNAYFSRLTELVSRGEKDAARIGLISIDEAAQLVVAFGMSFLDHMLVAVHHRIIEIFGEDVFCARLGEHRLAVIDMTGTLSEQAIENLFDKPFVVDGTDLSLSATSALVMDTSELDDAESLDRAGRTTLLKAMQTAPGATMLYSPQLRENIRQGVHLRSALRADLKRNALDFHFQPKLRLADASIVGAEILARWTLDGKSISPFVFVPLAEHAGLSSDLTFRAVEQLGAFAGARKNQGLPPLPVSLNLSLPDLGHEYFIERLLTAIHEAGLGPDTVQFEITETSAMKSADRTLEWMRALKQAGYRLSLDDFGTGFSSLGYLDQMPIDEVKIDKSFIQALTIDNARRSITASANAIAENLGLDVVAEGVETREQQEILRFFTIPFVQGFLYAKPMARQDFLKWETDWNSGNRPVRP